MVLIRYWYPQDVGVNRLTPSITIASDSMNSIEVDLTK